ncbi:MAG: hypothetical protein MRERC_4c081 [Mycoplasmataceae bacterium RC_NB112A]|nr:MAG: hypothetical protein MRERC_4c081 [Mycoplasmataceae bacterium RC_NB112A]
MSKLSKKKAGEVKKTIENLKSKGAGVIKGLTDKLQSLKNKIPGLNDSQQGKKEEK